MPATGIAAHVLSKRYPELTSDQVSRYVAHLKQQLGPTKASGAYSTACRAAPLADNPLQLRRGSVVEIEGERYLTLGSGFLTLEFASLARPGTVRTVGKDEFARLGDAGFRVLDEAESEGVLNAAIDA